MKTISIFHKLLVFKTANLYTLDIKIWKNILSSYESKKSYLNMQTTTISSTSVCISLEIIINVSKCLTQSLSAQILILAIALLFFISVSILREFAMLPGDILLSPQEEEVHSSSWGDRCTYLAAHSSKRSNPLSVIIFVCIGKTTLQDKLLCHWSF